MTMFKNLILYIIKLLKFNFIMLFVDKIYEMDCIKPSHLSIVLTI